MIEKKLRNCQWIHQIPPHKYNRKSWYVSYGAFFFVIKGGNVEKKPSTQNVFYEVISGISYIYKCNSKKMLIIFKQMGLTPKVWQTKDDYTT